MTDYKQAFLDKTARREAQVAAIGLGYVGLAVAAAVGAGRKAGVMGHSGAVRLGALA
jgi:UDP-N-acetyl-D-mannosaminuronate dehydrogenase